MGDQFEHTWRHERERLAALQGGLGGYSIACLQHLLSLHQASCADPARFARGYAAFIGAMQAGGYHADLGLRLGDLLRRAGLVAVQVQGWAREWTGAGPAPSVFLRTFEKVRDRVVASGALCAGEAQDFLALIQAPDFHALTAIHFAAWGQRPG